MDNIDLNFLKENEIEVIVSVIEKDFELKAAEKSRLCRLRKKLIRNDQKAVETSQTTLEGLCCVICFNRFVFILNPKKICCSCSLQICKSCCLYVKTFNNYLCSICQQQKDLIAMNCSWFYENIRRKFMDGGSQIVANSLSEYPRKNLISPAILNMVKGTQITKFRYQVEEASRTIEESLIKVELSFTDKETKSVKYVELIKKFVEKLKQILRNTSQVLYVTMENYLNKIGRKNNNIDLEVLNTLHEEVELFLGRKINIRVCQRNLMSGKKTLEDLDSQDSLETILSSPIVDKLLFDVQQSLMESRGKEYDDLNSTLKSMVKKTKYDFMDFDFESVSQAPSRQSTIRRNLALSVPQQTLYEISKSASLESLHSSRLYGLSEIGEKSVTVAKQWNELISNNSQEIIDAFATSQDNLISPAASAELENSMPTDSDAVSMAAVNQPSESNWLMKARCPLGSLNSLFLETNNPYAIKIDKKKSISIKSEIIKVKSNIDQEIEDIYCQNLSVVSDKDNLDLDKEYKDNFSVVNPVSTLLDKDHSDFDKGNRLNLPVVNPVSTLLDKDHSDFDKDKDHSDFDKGNRRNLSVMNSVSNPNNDNTCFESGESQDSGIVTYRNDQISPKPLVPSRKSKIILNSDTVPNAPPIPKRKSYISSKPSVQEQPYDSVSDSSVEDVKKKKKFLVVKGKTK